jgi:AhpD family alkylhydroperoxidase
MSHPRDAPRQGDMLMTSRMTQPAFAVPGAMDALNALSKSISRARLPIPRPFVHLRASQINGCSVCLDMHAKEALEAGESIERVVAVAAWRDTNLFSDAERAALELTEVLTRLSDRADQVPDDLWDRLTEHFDETQLAALVLDIASINVWNRLNIATRQIVGEQSW